MALPAGISKCTVTWGSLMTMFGTDTAVDVQVTPVFGGNADAISWSATGQTLVDLPETFSASAGSPATFVVPHVDQAGFIDGSGAAVTMWSYKAVATVKSANYGERVLTKTFQPLVGQTSVDLDLVPDGAITAPTSAPIPAVLSVDGQTGHVTTPGGALPTIDPADAGRLLAINDTGDALEWVDAPAGAGPTGPTLPAGGLAGQALVKSSTTDGDASWADVATPSDLVDFVDTTTFSTALGAKADEVVVDDALALKAPLLSPALTGNPTAPTQATTDNSTRLATTAFVKATSAPSYANAPAGSVFVIKPVGGVWPARPSSRTDLTFIWTDFDGTMPSTMPAGYISGSDEFDQQGTL